MIWGVCGGLAEYFGIDSTIVRVIAILMLFAGGSGILAYIILTIVIPLENSPSREPKDVFKENTFADVVAVTKGKGFQGIVKRFGVRRQPRKSTQKRRHMGTGGPTTPSRKMWFWPTPGQHGYHTRTEYNKAVLKVGTDGSDVTPKGGFLQYGPVKGEYILLKGSIPGPAKRIIRLTTPRRQQDQAAFNVTHIDLASKQGAA